MSGADPIPRDVALRAAQWYLLLHSGTADAAATAACTAWRTQSALHEQAWQRAVQVCVAYARLPASLAGPVLGRPERVERRRAVKALLALMLAVPAGVAVHRQAPWWMAEYRTAVGERRAITLADGTQVLLDTDTAIDIRYDGRQRLIALHGGEILVDSGVDAARRPLLIKTDNGSILAIGTRFIVRHEQARTSVGVLAGAVEMDAGHAPLRVSAGQQSWFAGTARGGLAALPAAAGAWQHGVLVASDMRLDAFLAELSRYRRGLLRCDPAVGSLRVNGVFQLHDSEGILHSLAAILPVQTVFRTRYWVTVVPHLPG